MVRRISIVERAFQTALALLFVAVCCVVSGRAGVADEPATAQPAVSAEGIEFFEKHIRPLFADRCLECHGDKKQGGLQLDTRAGMFAGSDSGPSVAPGDPDGSLLVQAVRYEDEPKMPPEGKLPDDAIAKLETWVKIGRPLARRRYAGRQARREHAGRGGALGVSADHEAAAADCHQ